MVRHARDEARLIEEYWSAVGRDEKAAPPSALDTDLAHLIRWLDHEVSLPDPTDHFVGELRARLHAAAPAGARDWTRPALDLRRPSQLTDTTDEEIEMTPSSGTPDAIPISSGERSWLREALKLAAAAIIFAVIGSILTLTLRDDGDGGSNVVSPGSTPTTTEQPAPSPTIEPTLTPTVVVTPTPQPAATATIAALVLPTAIPAIDPGSLPEVGEVAAVVAVGGEAQGHGIAASDGAVWVTNEADGTVQRIDPATNQVVATIPIREPIGPNDYDPFMVATGSDAVWVLDGINGALAGTLTLSQIDPATNQVAESFTVPNVDQLAVDGRWLTVGDDALWVGDWNNNRVLRIDPVTTGVVATIAVETPGRIAFLDDSVWVASRDANRVVRIDPATNEVIATIETGRFVLDLVPDENILWLSAADDEVLQQIDPATDQVVATLALPSETAGEVVSAGKIVLGSGSVWIGVIMGSVYQLDPATNAYTGILSVEGRVDANSEGSLWVVPLTGTEIIRVNVAP